MSKNAALTYVADNIRVNSLHPGIIDTPMIAAQDEAITEASAGKNMKALRFHAARDLRLDQIAAPSQPGRGQVLVKVLQCGI